MAKKVQAYVKLQIPAGQANPSPPVGPALGQQGVNIMEFCKAFNASTQSLEAGMPVPVVITVYSDRSFTFVTKTPPAGRGLMSTTDVTSTPAGATIQRPGSSSNVRPDAWIGGSTAAAYSSTVSTFWPGS